MPIIGNKLGDEIENSIGEIEIQPIRINLYRADREAHQDHYADQDAKRKSE